MKVVRIIEKSAGNETVGDMWKETEIFDDSQPISDLFKDIEEGYIMLSIPKSAVKERDENSLSF